MQVMFDTTPGSIAHIKAGQLRAASVRRRRRARTRCRPADYVGDFVPGYEASQWYGLVAPKDTPAAVIERLNNEVNAALATPGMKTRPAASAARHFSSTPADFGDLIVKDTAK